MNRPYKSTEAQRASALSYYRANQIEQRERARDRARLLSKTSPEFRRKQFAGGLRFRFKITFEQWGEMLIAQSGRCAICCEALNPNGKHTHVDHCHRTGRVRGVLCMKCNHMLGTWETRPHVLPLAFEYLREG